MKDNDNEVAHDKNDAEFDSKLQQNIRDKWNDVISAVYFVNFIKQYGGVCLIVFIAAIVYIMTQFFQVQGEIGKMNQNLEKLKEFQLVIDGAKNKAIQEIEKEGQKASDNTVKTIVVAQEEGLRAIKKMSEDVFRKLNEDGYIKECRICFRETEGGSQCQGARNTCSGWSKNPSYSDSFRDDTDSRPGGCTYSWALECR